MKRTFFCFPLLALLLSCNNGNAVNETPVSTQELSAAPGTVDSGNPLGQGEAAAPATGPAASAPDNAKAGLNPPHGQPGHRCEIPVGAPLDGSAAPNATPAAPAPVISQPGGGAAAPASPAAGKINPPHGQPGHDCAVPVGAPLP